MINARMGEVVSPVPRKEDKSMSGELTLHEHRCELLMLNKKCPNNFKDDYQDECDECGHLVIVTFYDTECTRIKSINRFD